MVDAVALKAGGGGGGFAVGQVGEVYALAQCWNTVGTDGCRECLRKAAKEVRGCLPKKEGRALNAGCYLRYSTHKFYNEEQGAAAAYGTGSGNKLILIFFWFKVFLPFLFCG